jgi:sodium-independent sulfate anion transporter 11
LLDSNVALTPLDFSQATAVGSLLVGQAIDSVNELRPDAYLPEDIARSLTLIVGILLVVFGLLRLGWVFEFIPYIPISAFVTAASLTIIVSQIPKVLGLSNINTKASAYRVALDTFGRLHETKWDALLGITVIVLLTVIKHSSAYMQKRHPQHAKAWKMISSLRMVVVMLLSMLISFLVNRNLAPHETKFRIVGHIDQGFQKVGAPQLDVELLALLAPSIPALFIILVVEHVAIAKAMSREHGYTIVTSQEVLASGMANTASPFFGGYVCTGSFGASAVLSSTGARTPLAGLFSGGVLVLALYALTTAFSYIPHATLAGLIIHAVWSLITPLPVLYKYWQISPTELLVWVAEVLLAVFTSLEVAMYTGIGLSIAVLLVRMARAKGAFVGQVQTNTVTDKQHLCGAQGYATSNTSRTTFARLDGSQGLNPAVDIRTPAPGVFVYGFTEGLNYTNQAQHMARIASYAKTHTRRGNPEQFGKDTVRDYNNHLRVLSTTNTLDRNFCGVRGARTTRTQRLSYRFLALLF